MATRKLLKKIIKNGQVYDLPSSEDFVDKTSNQTVAWVKTFSSEPVLPTKETSASNSKTAPANEWQVKQVADEVSELDWNVVKTTWNQTIWWTKTFSTAPVLPSASTLPSTPSNTKPATEKQLESVKDMIPSYWTISESDINTGTDTEWKLITAKAVHDYVAWIVASGVSYKWQVADYDSLPVSPSEWDMYNVVAEHNTNPKFPAWTNVIWNGTSWDPMTESVDLSNLVDKSTNQTIWWTKTFSTSPVVPAKNTDASASNTTVVATEAQVAKKLDSDDLWNATISVTQWGRSKNNFTTNQSSNWSIVLEWSIPCTQAEYDALPSSKASDNNDYYIYE